MPEISNFFSAQKKSNQFHYVWVIGKQKFKKPIIDSYSSLDEEDITYVGGRYATIRFLDKNEAKVFIDYFNTLSDQKNVVAKFSINQIRSERKFFKKEVLNEDSSSRSKKTKATEKAKMNEAYVKLKKLELKTQKTGMLSNIEKRKIVKLISSVK